MSTKETGMHALFIFDRYRNLCHYQVPNENIQLFIYLMHKWLSRASYTQKGT